MAEKESCICSQRSSMLASRAVRLEAFISANARAAAAAAGLAAGVGGRVPLPARGAEREAEGRGRRGGWRSEGSREARRRYAPPRGDTRLAGIGGGKVGLPAAARLGGVLGGAGGLSRIVATAR